MKKRKVVQDKNKATKTIYLEDRAAKRLDNTAKEMKPKDERIQQFIGNKECQLGSCSCLRMVGKATSCDILNI